MRNLAILLSFVITATLSLSALSTGEYESLSKSESEVKTLIETSYINGAFNDLDPDAMEKGFHEEFAIFSADGEKLGKYPIDRWVNSVRNRKNSSDFDASNNQWEHKFASVDVTGNSASAKVELFKDGKQVYTDYLSLLKFESGWKIVAKVYHQHR